MLSLIVPVYKNAPNIDALLGAVRELDQQLKHEFELVCVVDGSPDDSYLRLATALPEEPFRSQLLSLSRNFGSFAAIRAGLAAARGPRCAVMAADLQEPPEMVLEFDRILRKGDTDVVIGHRVSRADPLLSRLASATFWGLFRRLVEPAIPAGGVDVFGCTTAVRDVIVGLPERHSSLVALLFWVGFRRQAVPYARRQRLSGKSGWTLKKKVRYFSDSLFSFTDVPIKALLTLGTLGLLGSLVFAVLVLSAKLFSEIPVPGYAATVLLVTFFGGLNCFGLGVVGSYVWRTFENTKGRPNYIVRSQEKFERGT